jgi:hypothetical protein
LDQVKGETARNRQFKQGRRFVDDFPEDVFAGDDDVK